ncbi:uncharacterized protein LOC107008123 isoform X2 [Solanum pennellii]|uniref:Uncharacterized protein LOC107008123 isoform X2 n=1 Tax=Solanum pennellii TaxID=28526 RepID=A0ABM1V817_SOLPN|nr:uncharacterized protein LOC107008123 isoform X2 [Solanum pennellii]
MVVRDHHQHEPLPGQHRYMQRVDLYAEKEPWEILEGSNTNTGYFITPLKKEKSHHTRFKRTVGEGGTWKIQDPAKKVFDENGRLMGYVHRMKYTPANNKKAMIKELFGEWLMMEYSLYDRYVTNLRKKVVHKDFVICMIKKKKKKQGCDDGKKKDENIMNEVEVNELIDSVMEELEEIDDDNREVDVGDDFLAALEDECSDANHINLDEYDFVI